ncbi:ferredoxin [Planobispora longispora]|uniref:Ferredoxin n=1 Tax=Planobispora longispora TaxID=28887 RepID=A0A8J3W4P9_9ACTN|nr:ferredoxin [Planobispora longispora]GIH76639.1 ferredoxin [Planobispora longispora]
MSAVDAAVEVTVNRESCCGAGQCALAAPEVFTQSEEDGLVVLLDPNPPAELHDAVRRAESHCPTRSVTVR